MTTTTGAPPTTRAESQAEQIAKWVEVTRSLQPLVESEREESYRDASVTSRVVQAWKDAGLYRAQLPVELGGDGIDNVVLINIIEEIARQDASAGWTFGVSASGTTIAGVLLDKDSYLEIIGPDGDGLACGFANGMPPGTAKKVDGGYLVKTDPMPFGSATLHTTRVISLLFLVDDHDEKVLDGDGNPVVLMAYIDVKNVEWLNDWYASGLASTGSGHLKILEHVLEDKWFAHPETRIPGTPFAQEFWTPSILSHVGVALGLAKRALEEAAKATKNKRRGAVADLDKDAHFLYEFGRIEAAYQAARAFCLKAYQDAWDAAEAGTFNQSHINRIDQSNYYLTSLLNDIVSTAALWCGSGVVPRDGVVARIVADARVVMNHLVSDPQQLIKVTPSILDIWRDETKVNKC
ncbi:acyl-CoA dehydrogenase family protein [Nocardioides sp. NPDC051685]|uniref:acyl-CoA dehydrogenase family protein n=1 Tax=Nocardioides sp. NPDC051685 TaxID=3364334 RepID=UPI0037BB49F1